MYFSSFEAGNCVSNFQLQMTKNRTPTPVYLDPGMHPGLEVKGLNEYLNCPQRGYVGPYHINFHSIKSSAIHPDKDVPKLLF